MLKSFLYGLCEFASISLSLAALFVFLALYAT